MRYPMDSSKNISLALEALATRLSTPKQWYSPEALAEELEVKPRTVHNWLKDGLPSYKIGGVRRIRMTDFEAWALQFRDPKDYSSLEADAIRTAREVLRDG